MQKDALVSMPHRDSITLTTGIKQQRQEIKKAQKSDILFWLPIFSMDIGCDRASKSFYSLAAVLRS
ncbi:unnamed protein product [Brassica oleracea]|uniref:Uncharacterized protein n=1 Tax=Brassica oleracea TaxID=3712 RepID=A0A3P6EPX8_BRAOL|nr:unnamed protein product [Brassica oleracea]